MRRKLICLLLALFLFATLFQAGATEAPNTSAASILVVDLNTGQGVYSVNPDARLYPASLTKVMTVMLAAEAVERGDVYLTDKVTPSAAITYNLRNDGSTQNIRPGETMTLQDLMYCALVSSANEACNIIAEYLCGDIPTFVELMNQRAAELGCTNTHFNNAHGLPDTNHYTSARDMAIITQRALELPTFREICSTASYTVPATNMSGARQLSNTNALINRAYYDGRYFYPYAHGVKTGHTDEAGYCLISIAEKGELSLLIVVMGCAMTVDDEGLQTVGSFADSIALYNWAFDTFSYQVVLDTDEVVAGMPLVDGRKETVDVYASTPVTALMPDDPDLLDLDVVYYQEEGTVTAPIRKGTAVGEVNVYMGGELLGSSQLITGSNVGRSNWKIMGRNVKNFLAGPIVAAVIWVLLVLVVILVVLLILRFVRYDHVKPPKRKEKKPPDAPADETEDEPSEKEPAGRK